MKPPALCRGCGTRLDPAATLNATRQPAYDRHPGCEPGGTQLQLIKGGKR